MLMHKEKKSVKLWVPRKITSKKKQLYMILIDLAYSDLGNQTDLS